MAKNFPPTEALRPETSLELLIPELTPLAMDVDVIAAICSICELSIVIPAPAAWILPFEGRTNAAIDRRKDNPFPMRLMMNTARTTPAVVSMNDCADFPKLGSLLINGTVILVAAMSVESDTLLVEFAMSVSIVNL